jgi:2-beta-glucuronyltransferase
MSSSPGASGRFGFESRLSIAPIPHISRLRLSGRAASLAARHEGFESERLGAALIVGLVTSANPRVILISGHYLGSKRRAGFHHLANAYWSLGWDVTFVTAAISSFSRLKGDFRFAYPVREEANRLVPVKERLTSFVLLTRTHPGSLRVGVLNRLSTPWFARYVRVSLGPLEEQFQRTDLVVFEGTAALLLVERIRGLAPEARLVYRVSDDLRVLGVHPLILEAEAKAVPLFDLVSAPTQELADVLSPYGPVEVHPPGIDKAALDRPTPSPFEGPAAVFAGVSPLFDYESLASAAELAPHVTFHVIGPSPRPLPENVVFRPELPYEDVVPYLQHATFGLLLFPPGYASLGQGNKVAQYSYCRLPIVAPSYLTAERSNLCLFEHGDTDSLRGALEEAERMPHSPEFAEGVRSAEELAQALSGAPPAQRSE